MVCGADSQVYVEIKGVGAAFCKTHCENIISDLDYTKKVIDTHSRALNHIFDECEKWLTSRTEKFF